MRTLTYLLAVACIVSVSTANAASPDPTSPFTPDEHTLLLYHFDEGQGAVAKDSSGHGYDGEVRGAQWVEGRFGKALRFDGEDDCVFRKTTEALKGWKQLTVECWFRQDNPQGRQFLVGHDVNFHFDLGDGASTSLSLYNQGGSVPNAEGHPHQQIGAGTGTIRSGRWHHLAAVFDSTHVSFFLDGVLKARNPGGRDFVLGVPSRGLWVGSYVGNDYWFNGAIDEVRVSDNVRYDPEKRLQVGQAAFEMPRKVVLPKAVRAPTGTGKARLSIRLKVLDAGSASGWVYLKSPGKKAAIVGQYTVAGGVNQAESKLDYDVSDEWLGDGTYVVGLEPTGGSYIAVTEAALASGDKTVAHWSGAIRSRRTFEPPILVPLCAGPPASGDTGRILLSPLTADRTAGDLDINAGESGDPPSVFGEGFVEYWIQVPKKQTYRFLLRYASPGIRPCDLVIDGNDLHPYQMAARNPSLSPALRDAFWEYQGSATLDAGLHWIRIQDVLPAIVALRLEPAPDTGLAVIPWQRFPVPQSDFLGEGGPWQVQDQFGQPRNVTAAVEKLAEPTLKFAAEFCNVDVNELFAGDCVRLTRSGSWDLEPFGRLRFRFEGQGTGHVVSLRAVDIKNDEKLLWRARDSKAGTREIQATFSFEGNDVFDPGHVVAICLDLDEGNVTADRINRFSGSLAGMAFDRRDIIESPKDYAAELAQARQAIEQSSKALPAKCEPLTATGFRPWPKPVVPEEHPLFARSDPKPVTRRTLGYELHCTGARDVTAAALDQFHSTYDFGDVCWPHIGICPQRPNYSKEDDYRAALREMEKRLEDVRSRGLLLFDIWGYVPFDPQYPSRINADHHEILMRVMGDKFLGYDNGEQDGRYIGSFASAGKHTNRREGWEDFVRWDEHVCGESGNYMNATGSLNFSHYYGERQCRLLGLETAQGLPSDTLMFAFLRGAGKQYGRLLTQATSIWNRFGYNMYHGRKTDGANGYGYGPNKGCSLSLHKRLFFSSYLGGHSIAGTETSQFTGDQLPDGKPELSPLGKQHLELRDWFRKHPDRGVMHTPVALMLDFYNGWNMPRHLYRGDTYKIWGKFPYEKQDYLADGLFRLIWPGYEDCSYLRNERGFLTPTPYGDIFDVITNRCHPSVLKQYSCVMLLGNVEMTSDVVNNLTEFVSSGGDLVVDARSAVKLPGQFSALKFGKSATGCMSLVCSSGARIDEQPYTYTVAETTGAVPLLINEQGHPLIAVNRIGRGRVIVGTVDEWMTDPVKYRSQEIVNMEPPYLLLNGIRAILGGYFDSFNPVEVQPAGLGITTCCFDGDPKHLLVGLMNHDLMANWKGSVRIRVGDIASVTELWRGTAVSSTSPCDLAISAGDVAILDVRLK